ncbi:MAG: transglycosylase SLT domain-containing protein [Clostridia bacterium]|nr:transglycosylase SLT domain-containing protein [Clostridia bacterium]
MRKLKVLFSMALVLATMVLCMVPSFAATSNKDKVYTALVKNGLCSAAACGVMANIEKESNFNPSAGSTSGAYGLCQWTGSRRSNLFSYCNRNGYSSSSVEGQVAFLLYELRNSYSGVLNSLKSVANNADGAYNAGYRFCYDFERPANKSSRSSQRASVAKNSYWPAYKNKAEQIAAEETEAKKKAEEEARRANMTDLEKVLEFYGIKVTFVKA